MIEVTDDLVVTSPVVPMIEVTDEGPIPGAIG
jgi:hypothetical protein